MADGEGDGKGKEGVMATIEAPQKFEIGGKLFSLDEAKKRIEEADKFVSERDKQSVRMKELEELERDTRAIYTSGDVEAYRRVLQRSGKPAEQIESLVQAAQRLRNGQSPFTSKDPDSETDEGGELNDEQGGEVDDADARRANGNGKRGRTVTLDEGGLSKLVERITVQVKKNIDAEYGEPVRKLTDWAGRASKVMSPIAQKELDARLNDKLNSDDLLGPLMRSTGPKIDYIKREAKKCLREKMQERNGQADDWAFGEAAATARQIANTFGLLQSEETRRPAAAPYPGSPPRIAGSTGATPRKKQTGPPTMSDPNAVENLMDWIEHGAAAPA